MDRAAITLLGKHWDRNLPVNPVSIAQRIGIRVVGIHDFDEGVCGAISTHDGVTQIEYDANRPHIEQRFIIAHMLGHVVLGSVKDGEVVLKHEESFLSETEREADQQANQFATQLLIPDSVVRYTLKTGAGDLKEMARLFCVSEAAMAKQLEEDILV